MKTIKDDINQGLNVARDKFEASTEEKIKKIGKELLVGEKNELTEKLECWEKDSIVQYYIYCSGTKEETNYIY